MLSVKNSRYSDRPFRILLLMWGELAEMSKQHLKPNDYIYVSGYLGSYMKADGNENLRTNYKVNVSEINYVAQCSQRPTNENSEQVEAGEGESGLEKYKSHLHLWQVFFANPHEWWDNRKIKKNPKQPDFKHKDTGEALWLMFNDPPWVKRQLELHDSRLAVRNLGEHASSPLHAPPLMYGWDESESYNRRS